jgi:serine/threonine-protein kinase
MALRRGTRLGKYRLDRKLGVGGFSAVWRARDMVEGIDVALKITPPGLVEQWGRDAIEHEARVAARLEHPNIVRLRNADWIDGTFVMATELAQRSLDTYAGARRSVDVALRVLRDVGAGLAYAHERRILHRDIKPENVLIFADRHAALADFGTAREARAASIGFTDAGTLGYMAPEQAYGRPRYASDVFSLGMIAWEVITGVLPGWPFEWPLEGHRSFERRVPAPVQPVLRRALEVRLARRWEDGVAFQRAFERALERVEQPRTSRPRRRTARREEATPFEIETQLFRRRHGRSLELRYDCHRCGGPFSEAMGHCPWCGTGDNSLVEITSHALVCPACEHGVRPEWNHCPWCYAGRLQGNGRRPPPDPRAERSCTRRGCDGQLRAFMRYCPRCGQKPRRPWTHEALEDRCGRCRCSTHPSWRYCPWCGRRQSAAAVMASRRPAP